MTLWFVARSAGFVALIAFTLSVVLGAASSDAVVPPARTARSVGERDRVLDRRLLRRLAHRSAAMVGLGALALHLVLILLDSYADVSLSGALVPLTAGYRPIAVGLGTTAVYLFVLAALSGAARGRLAASDAAAGAWRWVHGAAYVGWVLALGHGILAGTDTGQRWSTAVYAACAVAVLVAVWGRIGRAGRRALEPLGATRALRRRPDVAADDDRASFLDPQVTTSGAGR